MKTLNMLYMLIVFIIASSSHAADKTFIDYFLPMPKDQHPNNYTYWAPEVICGELCY